MRKYLTNMINRLTGLKTGIHNNAAKWAGQPVAEADIDAALLQLNNKVTQIDAAEDALKERQREAHNKVHEHEGLADQAENLARGIHQSDPEKLTEYNIKERKQPEPQNPPGMALIASLKDDTDGIGFILTTKALPHATDFEIERSVTAADVQNPGEWRHLTNTKKLTYTDDDVTSGMRHHYRVRGYNRKGKGPWSASISGIQ